MRIDLKLVAVLEAVMLERNVTRAAVNLAMSQPAVSNALRRARALMDDKLFLKTAEGVEPTARMMAIWPDLHRSLDVIRTSINPLAFDPGVDTTTFRVAVTDSLSADVVPALALCLGQCSPSARVAFRFHTNASSLDGIERGTLDCAVGMFPALPLGIHVCALRTDHYLCVMRRGHPIGIPVELDAFVDSSHVLVSPSGQELGVVDGWLSLREHSRKIVAVVNHFRDALNIVADSDLLTCVPNGAYQGLSRLLPNADGLVTAPLPFETERLLYKVVWHQRVHAHPAHRWFRQRLIEICNSSADVSPATATSGFE